MPLVKTNKCGATHSTPMPSALMACLLLGIGNRGQWGIGVSVHFLSFLLKPIDGKLIANGI